MKSKSINQSSIKIWLMKRLLKGIGTTHEDAINAGFHHRLACDVLEIRRKGFYGVILTFERKVYMIPTELRKMAIEMAANLGLLR